MNNSRKVAEISSKINRLFEEKEAKQKKGVLDVTDILIKINALLDEAERFGISDEVLKRVYPEID
ncbi:hypothetical protein [Bacillus paralicheniformis]|uniref:hypothetical protein n=1 Tax=Bacillus paralicheniformis TaxID=1648923 RepID=UPI0020406802|nr:hypothetical protein [Bacillus paralicheniformis]MCM3425576.1 hypothetical protein [Bacillus paralicheniformis]